MNITIKRYKKNPIPATFFGLLNGSYNSTIEETRIVTDREIEELAYLQLFGIKSSLLEREPDLNCAVIINACADYFNKGLLIHNPRFMAVFNKMEAFIAHQLTQPYNK